MTTISQTIPNYVLGISEQPDQLKSAGQVRDLVNAVPDVTLMCAKRPGSECIAELSNQLESAPDVKWFEIDRSEYEQYMGAVKPDGSIDMWRLVYSSGPFVRISSAGSGINNGTYYNTPTTTTSNGDGTGLTLDITVTGAQEDDTTGTVTSAYIKSYGQNYKTGDVIDATVGGIAVQFHYFECTPRVNVTAGGTGYIDGAATVSGTSGVELTLTTSGGAITSAEITDAGDGSSASGGELTVSQEVDGTTVDSGTLKYKTGKAGEQLEVGYEGDAAQTYLANSEPSFNIKHLTVGDYTFLTNRKKAVSMAAMTARTTAQVFKFVYKVKDNPQTTGASNTSDRLTINLDGTPTVINYYDVKEEDSNWTDWDDWATTVSSTLAGMADIASATVAETTTETVDNINITTGSITVTMADTDEHTLTLRQEGQPGIEPIGHNMTDLYLEVPEDISGANVGYAYITTLSGDKKYAFKLTKEDGTELVSDHDLEALTQTVTADTALDGLIPGFTSRPVAGEFTYKKIGNGIFIYSPTVKFNLSTTSPSLLNVFTNSVQNVAILPTQCKHGYKVKVANTDTVDDDYHVKFVGSGNADGSGYWEETVAGDVLTKIDPNTMPHQLRRNSDNSFTVVNIDYADRIIGDDITNQPPSFVGSYTPQKENAQPIGARYINNIVNFRNRLGFLSGDNIILSRPGEFFNFFNNTAITISPKDPIDIAVSDTKPATLYDAIEANVGLVLFSRSQQFLLTTDGDTLSPATAAANFISSYNYNINVSPISLGTTQAFVKDDGRNTQFFEMQTQKRDGEPQLLELSKIISAKLPTGINKLSNSRGSGTVLMSKKGSNEVWGHRYFNTGEERLQSSWFRWLMKDEVYHHCIIDDVVYFVQKNNSQLTLQKLDLKEYDDDATYDGNVIPYRVHLDNRFSVYDAGASVATSLSPYTLSDGTINFYHEETGLNGTLTIADSAISLTNNSDDEALSTAIQEGTIHFGYEYEMKVEFPKIFPTQGEGKNIRADINGSLIIHRVKLSCGKTGTFDVLLERKGYADDTNTFEAIHTPYNLDSNAFVPDRIVTVPIYARNTNTDITFKSKYPTPTTLISMTWEGDYTNKMYQRA